MGGASRAMSVTSWPVRAAGYDPSALRRRCHRIRSDEANGQYRTAPRTGTSKANATGATREVCARSAVGRWPNEALQRIAARWRLCLNRKAASGPLALRAGVRPGWG